MQRRLYMPPLDRWNRLPFLPRRMCWHVRVLLSVCTVTEKLAGPTPLPILHHSILPVCLPYGCYVCLKDESPVRYDRTATFVRGIVQPSHGETSVGRTGPLAYLGDAIRARRQRSQSAEREDEELSSIEVGQTNSIRTIAAEGDFSAIPLAALELPPPSGTSTDPGNVDKIKHVIEALRRTTDWNEAKGMFKDLVVSLFGSPDAFWECQGLTLAPTASRSTRVRGLMT